jgi:DNA polymerase-4
MRKAERLGRTVTLRLRFDDFTRATRSHTLPWATAETALVLSVARGLLGSVELLVRERGITLLGVSVANLDDAGSRQLELPFGRRGSVLDDALDDVREKFGTASIGPAVLLGRDPSVTVPMLPE